MHAGRKPCFSRAAIGAIGTPLPETATLVTGASGNRQPYALADQIGQSVIKPDFSWHNGTVVEYDSEQEHSTPAARARDERKRRAYQSVGMDCLTLNNDILRSNERYNWFAGELEHSLGIYRKGISSAMAERRRELRERLFGPETEEAALAALSLGL